MIIQYIKKTKKELSPKKKSLLTKVYKQGVLVSFVDDVTQKPKIGWSLVNLLEGDKFDRTEGIRLAKERSFPLDTYPYFNILKLPLKLREPLQKFYNRCLVYYK